MPFDPLDEVLRLRGEGRSFVLATVVRADRPTSAKPGAKAIVTEDGRISGWVGGSCAQPTVVREALQALRDGRPRLVSLSPPEELGRRTAGEVIEVPLTCVSGGALEIYLEPYLPRPQLVLIGHLAVTRALASLGHELGFSVSVVSPEEALGSLPGAPPVLKGLALDQLNLGPRSYVVVASHGNYDEEGVEAALRTSAGYVALVASRKRAESIREYLRETDVAPERAAELRCPAGLDIGAATPEEIALSILAEIVQFRRRSQTAPALGEAPRAPRAEEAVDPVCGMSVQVGTARHKTEHEGRVYYFCAASCQRAFEKDPQARLAAFRDGESQ